MYLGLFLLQRAYIIAAFMVPLISFTLIWSYQIYKLYQPLCQHVSLSLIAGVQKGESAENVLKLKGQGKRTEDETVTSSQAYILVLFFTRFRSKC